MITKRQKQVWDFIKHYMGKYGYAPALEEIKNHLKLSSVSTAHHHVKALEKNGLLLKEGNQPRAIDLIEEEIMIKIPLLGLISAGKPIEAIENKEEIIAISKNKLPRNGKHYALRVDGDSMIEEGIDNGDVVIINAQNTANNGDKVVALINDNEATLKKFYLEKNNIRLQPANVNMSPIYVDPADIRIQGKVISIIKTNEHIDTRTAIKIKPRMVRQNPLFPLSYSPKFPSTRFQGSKAKLANNIWECIKTLPFESAIDLFGGTGSIGYILKKNNKQVFYNDYLKSNYISGLALIENSNTTLNDADLDFILSVHSNMEYPDFIQKTFNDIYFTDQENKWLDIISTNIRNIRNKYKQALALFALFQSCLAKRPYNLFHRKNLYVRLANVERNFGNKTTWDKPFEEHFIKYAKEANEAVFDNGKKNRSFNEEAFALDVRADLTYIDTPYISNKGTGVDYLDFYHFLEGLSDYSIWHKYIDYSSKHRKYLNSKSIWSDKDRITDAFDHLFKKYKNSILVVSYRSDGIPSPEQLQILMKKYKTSVREALRHEYKYVLSKNGDSKEILLIGE